MRLIDADRLKRVLARDYKQAGGNAELMQIIDQQPINPIKHGKWLSVCEGEGNECSVCGYLYFGGRYKYCPECGAAMWWWEK